MGGLMECKGLVQGEFTDRIPHLHLSTYLLCVSLQECGRITIQRWLAPQTLDHSKCKAQGAHSRSFVSSPSL